MKTPTLSSRDNSSTRVELSEDGELRLEFVQAIGHDQVYFSAQSSDDFKLWQAEGVEYRGRINNGDGTEIVRFRINDSVRVLWEEPISAFVCIRESLNLLSRATLQ
ncbi:MAG: hypothetical protein ACJ0K4_01160 [Verrucomicrobiales bacterium]